MPFWLALFLFIGFTVIGELLRPKPKFDAPRASSLGDFNLPTAQEGRSVPVIYGTVKMAGPNVVWYGDLYVRAVTKKVKSGMFSSTNMTTGYRYYLGAQLVLCHGEVDEVLEVRFDDRAVPFAFPPRNYLPIAPCPSSWGLHGAATAAEAVDDFPQTRKVLGFWIPSHDGDATYVQGCEGNVGVTAGTEWSFGPPRSTSFTGWKLHFWAKQTGTGVAPLDALVIWGPSGALRTIPNFLTDRLVPGAPYVELLVDLTEAEAAILNAGNSMHVQLLSYGYGGDPGCTHIVTQSWLEVPGAATDEPLPLYFDAETAFGGEEHEGGIVGTISVYRGTQTQVADPYLTRLLGPLPAYRGICYIVLNQLYVGTSPYLKPISVVARRCPNALALGSSRNNINGDANPAEILYEILTNDRWGLGLPAALIDVENFRAVGVTLSVEQFGLSMIVDGSSSARDLLAEVLRHIDAVIYTDPITGRLQITLARANYQPTDPMVLMVDHIASCKVSRPSWADTKNNVRVSYVERATVAGGIQFAERIAQAQDLANIQIRGGEVSEQRSDYRGVSNAALAQQVASRELKTLSYPLAVLELEVNRLAWNLRPGSVFRLTWDPLGIVDMACRVTRISTGVLKDGAIKIDAVEDIFGVSATGYLSPSSTGWVNPVTVPDALAAAALLEVPYALVVGTDRLVATLGSQGTSALLGYQAWVDAAGGTSYVLVAEVRELTPSALLVRDLSWTDVEMEVSTAAGLALINLATDAEYAAGSNVVLVDNELMAWRSIGVTATGTYVVRGLVRGVADTVPAPHGVGVRAWFISEGSGIATPTALVADVTVAAKLLAYTSIGVQDAVTAPALTLTTQSRASRPYVPRNVTINGASYPAALQPYTDIAVAWAHRNRLSDWSWADGGLVATPEAGTTYSIAFYGDSGTLLRTYAGVTGTSQTWTDEVADSGGRRNEYVRVTVTAVVGGLASYQVFDFTIYRSLSDVGLASLVVPIGRRRRRRAHRGAVLNG